MDVGPVTGDERLRQYVERARETDRQAQEADVEARRLRKVMKRARTTYKQAREAAKVAAQGAEQARAELRFHLNSAFRDIARASRGGSRIPRVTELAGPQALVARDARPAAVHARADFQSEEPMAASG